MCFSCNIKTNYSSLSKSTREFEINYLAQAYQNIYLNGYALYDSTVGIIIFPDTLAPTLFHEYAHGFDANFLNETDRAIVQQSFDTEELNGRHSLDMCRFSKYL